MKKNFYFLFVILTIFFGYIAASEADWAEARDFSEGQLRTIARQVVNSEQGEWRLESHIIPNHAQDDALNAGSQGNAPKSYFRLQNHNLDIYRNILNYAINNGEVIIGEESSPKRFSILALIPNNELANFGAKENASIGAWMRGADYKQVSKIKAVFSVINMRDDMANLSVGNLIVGMKNMNQINPNKRPGDLITLFPIPNNWNK